VLGLGASFLLRPGSAHLMFRESGRALVLGDTVHAVLDFARAGRMVVPLVVRPYGGK